MKDGGQPALAFASERGSHVPAEKRETVSRKEEGKRKKRKTRTKIETPQNLRREEGASKRGAREKTHPKRGAKGMRRRRGRVRTG